ncbi:hypothetical protein V6N13_126613 [Hibiscus sabdariffa]|uniref:Uncharacterized protein n=1 Tax=Hibiscus sabdariffa TaxID=183260 RepID=A0ABR2REZ9_9ROSI
MGGCLAVDVGTVWRSNGVRCYFHLSGKVVCLAKRRQAKPVVDAGNNWMTQVTWVGFGVAATCGDESN